MGELLPKREKKEGVARKPGSWNDELASVEQLIRMVLGEARGKHCMEPITIRAKKRVAKLLGIQTMQTRGKRVYWMLPFDLGYWAERCGFDSVTHECVNRGKLKAAVEELDAQEANKLKGRYEREDMEGRTAALREVMQTYRPTRVPVGMRVEEVLRDQVLNRRIAKHLREEEERD